MESYIVFHRWQIWCWRNNKNSESSSYEDEHPKGKPEPAKHLYDNTTHKYFGGNFIFCTVTFHRPKIFKEFFVTLAKLESNVQVENNYFSLVRRCYLSYILSKLLPLIPHILFQLMYHLSFISVSMISFFCFITTLHNLSFKVTLWVLLCYIYDVVYYTCFLLLL